MKTFLVVIGAALAMSAANAADTAQAQKTLTKALTCEAKASAQQVLSALKVLKAKPSKDNSDYILPSPISVFGLPVTKISVDEDTPSFTTTFDNVTAATVANAGGMKAVGKAFTKDATHGYLTADVRDKSDVWVTCVPK
jgi:hypothetical protein